MDHLVLPSVVRQRDGEAPVADRRDLAGLGYVLRVIAIEAHGRRARALLDRDEHRRAELGLD
jgi:hypothetical protein